MTRARVIFKGATNSAVKGTFTHSPLIIPKTADSAKDLLWFMDRYPLELPRPLGKELRQLSARYDAAIIAARNKDSAQLVLSALALQIAVPLYDHQIKFRNLAMAVHRILLADKMGLGKTASAISLLPEPDARPAIVVAPTHLCTQWMHEIERFLPGAVPYIIKGIKPHPLPEADVYITAYTRLQAWEDVLVPLGAQTLILDEVQDLRHWNTEKRRVARALSGKVEYSVGLSGTPIYNYGGEIYSVLDVIYPGALGSLEAFRKEFCSYDLHVSDPAALNTYLTSRGLMLRRTPEDVGQTFSTVSKHPITLDADLHSLAELKNVAKLLAISVLSNQVGKSEKAARELDWKLRHATGVAKAGPVAEFVKMLAGEGEKVLLVGWHRDVYDRWAKDLKSLNPVFYTGTESPAQKEKAKKAFIEGNSRVFVLSLRSGAGLDGLQKVCSCCVFGELDWSPHVMDQVIGRLDRPGQERPVRVFYLNIEDGSDPFMLSIIGAKRSQHDGVIEGNSRDAEIVEDVSPGIDRLRGMAKAYLESIGEKAPEVQAAEGLQGEIASALRRLRIQANTEEELQAATWKLLPSMIDVQRGAREFAYSKNGRLDFLFCRGGERIAIECKLRQADRAAVYRQVRRYVEDAGITGLIVFAPWSGVLDFDVDGTPVTVVDWSKAHL